MTTIDLNCDMGESFGAWPMGHDAEVMPWISSANIACGGHAGDPDTMRATVEAAVRAGVAVGAHVGLPDKTGFGRRRMEIAPAQVGTLALAQIGALHGIARACGARLAHVKPHGALYHMAEDDVTIARALAEAVRDIDLDLALYGFAGGTLVAVARDLGIAAYGEGFVDRGYGNNGKLVPRGEAGAVFDSIDAACTQAVALATQGEVSTRSGARIAVRAGTLCIHGDRDDAAELAEAAHKALAAADIAIRAPCRR